MSDPRPDAPRDGAAPLTTAYRAIRRLTPPDSPFDGVLARSANGDAVVLVGMDALGEWPGWNASEAHVLGPLDVALTDAGPAAVLPWCTERIDRLLVRRRATSSRLTGGEAVTLAVSIIRGIAGLMLGARGATTLPQGAWWLTDAACPVFVHATGAEGERHAGDSMRPLLEAMSGLCDDPEVARVLDVVRAGLDDPRSLAHDTPRLEAMLFSAAHPEPIMTSAFAPARAREVTAARERREAEVVATGESPRRTMLAPLIDAGLADLVSGAFEAAGRVLRERRRVAAWSVAAVVGAAVLTVGLLWPDTADSMAVAQDETAKPSAAPVTPSARPEGQTVPSPTAAEESAPENLESEASRLLSDRTACAGDRACLTMAVEDPGIAFPAGIVDAARADRRVTLLDEFGGAAVLRVESTDGTATPQLVVLVLADHGWLLRDVHDVAQQPD